MHMQLQIFDPTAPLATSTTYWESTRGILEAGTKEYIRHKPKTNKNASEASRLIAHHQNQLISGSTQQADFSTANSAASEHYERTKPILDRTQAFRTNYTLAGSAQRTLNRSSAEDAYAHPSTKSKVEQAKLGGWTTRDGRYKYDMTAMESIRRGGGGSGGAFGVDFDIITCAPRKWDHKLGGYKISPNAEAKGSPDLTYDIIQGRARPQYKPPTRRDPELLKRPNIDILRSRPW